MGAKKSRKSPRAQISLVARYRSPTAFEFVSEECFDLSVGGMFIKSPAPAPAGTLLKLECDVDEGTAKIRGVARVVWLREQPADGHPAGMGVKFVKLDPGGRDVINGILDRVGSELDEEGELRRSDAPARASAEPFRHSPSSRPATDGDPTGDAVSNSPLPVTATSQTAPLTAAPGSDAVTVRPPPGPLPVGAASPEARARTSDRSSAGDHDTQSAGLQAASTQPTPLDPELTPHIDAERAGTDPLQQRLDQASSQYIARGAAARSASGQVAKPAPRASKSQASSAQPSTQRRSSSARPWAYAAIALLAAGGVYALSNGGLQRPQAAVEVTPAEPAPVEDLVAEPVAPAAPIPDPVAAAIPTEPAPAAAAEPAAADPQAAVPTSIAPAAPRYVLEVISNPEGARITAAGKAVTAPAEIDLGELAHPISVRAEKDGYSPSAATVDRLGFMLEEGAMRRRVVLKLHEAPADKPQRDARKSRRERAEKEERKPAAEPEPPPAVAQPAAEPPPAPVVTITPTAPAAAPAAPTAEPKPAKVEAKAKPEPETETPTAASPKQRPIDAAMDCLSTGDNACVIKALEGKAKTAQELELLIETYRTMGNAAKAEKYMKTYVDKHPGERRAAAYQRVLDNRQNDAPAP